MSVLRVCLLAFLLLAVASGLGALGYAARLQAQSPTSLDDETMLSLVLPTLADGSRYPVHRWARADQAVGPGGVPTVFVVTLYAVQGASGSEEREIVNYLQSTNGAWTPVRPRGEGTLLVDDWAWLSQNLQDLKASVSGQGDTSQYIVDYSASGTYQGAPRQLDVEEVYAADLSLVSSTVINDSSNPSTAMPAGSTTATPAATTAPATTATAPAATAVSGIPPASSPRTATAVPTATQASQVTPLPAATASSTATPAPTAPNTIRTGSPTP